MEAFTTLCLLFKAKPTCNTDASKVEFSNASESKILLIALKPNSDNSILIPIGMSELYRNNSDSGKPINESTLCRKHGSGVM